jgi:Tfp pilus assembly protein PilN
LKVRVVNLSRRPFVNRRPIVRISTLLWIVGAVLLVVNVDLYTSHWRGSAKYRRQLAEVREKIARQQELLAVKSQKFHRVSLDRRNRRAAFLNQLIDARTFPWSALFDDLEEVLPDGVRLVSVRPEVRLASNRRSRAQAERVLAQSVVPAEDELAQDEVELRFNGVAQSFDQLEMFVSRLYDSPFRNPYLSNTGLDPTQGAGSTSFTLAAIYLTRREPLAELGAEEPLVAETGGEPAAPGASSPGSPAPGSPPTGTPSADLPAGSRRAGAGVVQGQVGPRTGDAEGLAAPPDGRRRIPGSPPPSGADGGEIAADPERGSPNPGSPNPGSPNRGRAARPDAPGRVPAGLVSLPENPPPAEAEPPPPQRPTRVPPQRPTRVPPQRPTREPAPPREPPPPREPAPGNGPSPRVPDASSAPSLRQQPRELGSLGPPQPWVPWWPPERIGGELA